MQGGASRRAEVVSTKHKQKRLGRGGKNTEKNYTRKASRTWVTTMVRSTNGDDILPYEVKWSFRKYYYEQS